MCVRACVCVCVCARVYRHAGRAAIAVRGARDGVFNQLYHAVLTTQGLWYQFSTVGATLILYSKATGTKVLTLENKKMNSNFSQTKCSWPASLGRWKFSKVWKSALLKSVGMWV